MKAKIFNGRLLLIRGDKELTARCYHAGVIDCDTRCPHLDDSEPGIIRLTCGGTDVVLERAEDEDE